MARPAVPLTAMMDNLDAYRLGFVALSAGHIGRSDVGDSIDRGLILNHQLNQFGFALIKLDGHFLSVSEIDTPLAPEWLARMSYAVAVDDQGRDALIRQGWTPPPAQPGEGKKP